MQRPLRHGHINSSPAYEHAAHHLETAALIVEVPAISARGKHRRVFECYWELSVWAGCCGVGGELKIQGRLQSPALSDRPPQHESFDGDESEEDRHFGDESLAAGPDDPPLSQMAVGEAGAEVDSRGVIQSGNLAGRTMWAAIWILALPVLIQQTMAATVGLVDKIIAGSLPETIVRPAMDGIGIGSYVGWFIGIAMTGLGIGGQALIARAMGAGDAHQSHRALAQAVSVSVLWGAFIGVVMYFGVYPMTQVAHLSPDAAKYCTQYVQTLAYFMPFCGIMMVGSMCMHGAGETLKPSLIAVLVNVINIGLTWFLSGVEIAFGSPDSPDGRWTIPNPSPFDPEQVGVIGIAAGSGLGFFCGAVMTLIVLFRGVKDLRLEVSHMPFDGSMIWRFVRIGVPNFFEGMAMWASNLFVIRFIGQIAVSQAEAREVGGEVAEGLHGAHMIAVQWEAFSFMPGFAIGTAAGALAGQYLGAGNARDARLAIMKCTIIGSLIMGLLGLVFIFGGEFLTSIISHDPVHLQETPRVLFLCGLIQVFFAITMVVRQSLRGVGDTKWVFIITVVSSYGVRLPAAWFFGVYMEYGLLGIWMGLCGELVIRAMLFFARYLHGGWQHVKV